MFGPQIPTVTVNDITDATYLLDVREDGEWVAGHAPGAHHLPMTELPARLAEVPNDVDVAVICRSGGRSGHVVAHLVQQGWDRVSNVEGGMQQWAAAGRPVTTDSGAPGQVV
ncbi:rhodanese-like domain-containing protein [Micromonospora sp. NPDC023956]|uniref:rhodanese-like domain-containing protein n=1 Tax=Micromonospora sp. NPDC023956 TaxID=3155722 RepID=UPI0033F9C43C